ncbi:hypothetical protein DESA109040_14870 [Deinococcus saxicola]
MRETLHKLTHLLDGYLIEIVDKKWPLVHLRVKEVRRCIQRLEKWRLKGQKIETPGRLLMHLLNEKARAATGFNINGLGTEPGAVLS